MSFDKLIFGQVGNLFYIFLPQAAEPIKIP